MKDVRKQIADALAEITENIRLTRPEGDCVFPLITYAEISNVRVNRVVDRLEYQVDAYTSTFGDCVTLTRQIDDVMTGLGWTRTYVTPDTQARRGKDFYQKSCSYVARVDTVHNNIIKEM